MPKPRPESAGEMTMLLGMAEQCLKDHPLPWSASFVGGYGMAQWPVVMDANNEAVPPTVCDTMARIASNVLSQRKETNDGKA